MSGQNRANVLTTQGAVPEWLTVGDVCQLLQVPKWWVYEHARTRDIPHYKLGKYLRFRRDEIEAWLARHRRSRENFESPRSGQRETSGDEINGHG